MIQNGKNNGRAASNQTQFDVKRNKKEEQRIKRRQAIRESHLRERERELARRNSQPIIVEKKSGRILAFILGMLFGIILFVGSIAGALFLGYKYATLDMFGVRLPITIEDGAQKDINKMTVEQLVKELTRIYGASSTYTVNEFKKEFGINLAQFLPFPVADKFLDYPVLTLFSTSGINEMMEEVLLGDLFYSVGSIKDMFDEPTYELLSKVSLANVVTFNTDVIFDGVLVGGLMKMTYNAETQKYENDDPVMRAVGNAYVTDLLKISKGESVMSVVSGIFSDTKIDELLGTTMFGDKLMSQMLTDSGFDIDGLLDGMKFAQILGYTYDEDAAEWYKEEDGTRTALDGMFTAFSDILISDLMSDPDSAMDGVTIGSVMGLYEMEEYLLSVSGSADPEKYYKNGAIYYKIDADETTFTPYNLTEEQIAALTRSSTGQGDETKLVSKWAKKETVGGSTVYSLSSGITAAVSGIKINELDGDAIKDCINVLTLGEVLDTSGNSLLTSLKDTPISDLATDINDTQVGTAMGLTFDSTDNRWEDENGAAVTGVQKAIAGLTIGNLSSGSTLTNTINGLTLGEIIEISGSSGILYAIKDMKVGDLSGTGGITSIYAGYAMDFKFGYFDDFNNFIDDDPDSPAEEDSKWYKYTLIDTTEDYKAADGLDKKLAGTKISEMGSIMSGLTLGDTGMSLNSGAFKIIKKPGNLQSDIPLWYDGSDEEWAALTDSEYRKIIPVTKIDTVMTDSIKNATMGDMVDSGLLELSETSTDKLDSISSVIGDWHALTITQLLTALIAGFPV